MKFRSKNEIASYIKQKKLSLNVDNFSFMRSANDVTTFKVDERDYANEKDDDTEKAQEKGNELSTKKIRGRQSSASEKVPAKTPSTSKKPTKVEVVQKEDDTMSATTSERKKSALGRRGSAKVAAESVSSASSSEIVSNETPLTKKARAGRQKKSDVVVSVDENTQDYSKHEQGDVVTNAQNIEDKPIVPNSDLTPAFSLPPSDELQGLPADSTLPNVAPQSTEVTHGKRIRTPKLFADEIPTLEERRLSQDEASHKLASLAKASSSEIEGSRKKKGGRPPKKVEQNVADSYNPFAKRQDFASFSSPHMQTPVVKPKKVDVRKRKVDFEFENDLDLIAHNSELDRGPYFEALPLPKKERKSSGGRSSWGEIRLHDERTSPIDVQKVEQEAKKEKERGKYFEPVIMTGRRERKKSSWTKGEWVDPESITSLQWSGSGGGGVSSSSRGYDFDNFYSPRTASGGGSGSSRGRKKEVMYGYDKAKEDSVLADLYSGVYGEPSGTMSHHSQSRHRASGRKSYDADDDMGGSALRMHLSQPSVPPVGPSIDELFIAEQSMKNRDLVHAGRLSATGGMYRKVGTSFLSKALGERKERAVQDDLPPVICPHPSEDHTYSSLVIRQQQPLADPMLDDDDDTEDFDVGLSLLHGNDDDAKVMVAPTASSLPNGGRNLHQQHQRQSQQQFILPMQVPTVLPPQQPVEKVAVQFVPLPSVGNGNLPIGAVLENGLINQTERYRPDDVSGTTVGESLPLVLMEDDVLERSDSADNRTSPLHAATSKLTVTTTATS